MPDDITQPPSPRKAAARKRRRPRFALPADHLEEAESTRTIERIEAFLDGPARPRRAVRRPTRDGDERNGHHPGAADAAADAHAETLRQPRPVIPLDTRADWDRALRLEDARVSRYGRPASVIVVDVEIGPVNGSGDAVAGRVGLTIRAQARETDRVARVGPGRFHVLLPETDAREADRVADRIVRHGAAAAPGIGVRAAGASAIDGTSLLSALRRAQADLEG